MQKYVSVTENEPLRGVLTRLNGFLILQLLSDYFVRIIRSRKWQICLMFSRAGKPHGTSSNWWMAHVEMSGIKVFGDK